MSRTKKGIFLAIVAIALLFMGMQRAWFAAEPTRHGKTVTAWLDLLVLYDRQTNAAGVTREVARSSERIAQEPALEALLQLGPKATPILKKRLTERALWDSNESQAKLWSGWLWRYAHGDTSAPTPSPRGWPEFQRSRKTAAGFMLLVLGTNANAGFGSYMETYAAARKGESVAGTQIPGTPVGVSSQEVTQLAIEAFPQRKEEIFAEILKGLRHTNGWCRVVALECIRAFPDQLVRWKDPLLLLTRDKDGLVREAALDEMLMIVQQPKLRDALTAAEIANSARAVTEDAAASPRVKELAEVVLKLAVEVAATNRRVETAQPAGASNGSRLIRSEKKRN